MKLSENEKKALKNRLVSCLYREKEIEKIVIFGSFNTSDNPNDIDILIYQNSDLPYLPLALKYRKKTRSLSKKIPLDIIPVTASINNESLLFDIKNGEVVYEK